MTTISGHTAPAVSNWLLCTDVSATTTLERPISSLGPALNYQASLPMSETQSQCSGSISLFNQHNNGYWGLAISPWSRPLTASLLEGGGVSSALEKCLVQVTKPYFASFRYQSRRSPLDPLISLHQLWLDVMAHSPDHLVEQSEPPQIRPTSLCLTNCQ